MKRGVNAFAVILLSLFAINMEAFFKHNAEPFNDCKTTEFGKFVECCSDLSSIEKISEGYELVEHYIRTSNFETLFSSFNKEGKRLHQAMLIYMRMITIMLDFIHRGSTDYLLLLQIFSDVV